MDWFDITLAITKFFGITLAGAFGVIALLVEYKDQQGKVTKWGRIALSGVIVSMLLSMLAHGLELSKQSRASHVAQRKTLEAVERNQNVLNQISRVL